MIEGACAIPLLYAHINLRFEVNRGEALESFRETVADADRTAPRIKLSVTHVASMCRKDSEKSCSGYSAPMAICMIEASNAFVSLLPALLGA